MLGYRDRTQHVEGIDLGGSWLGLVPELEEAAVPVARFTLSRGHVLVLYTDGVVEAAREGEMFGYERLSELVREHAGEGPGRLVQVVLDAVESHSGIRDDDMTMLVIDHSGERVDSRNHPSTRTEGGMDVLGQSGYERRDADAL